MKKILLILTFCLFGIVLLGQSVRQIVSGTDIIWKKGVDTLNPRASITGSSVWQEADYIIGKFGTLVYAHPNPHSSYATYSGATLSTVLNSVMATLTTGGKVYIKEGLYDNCDSKCEYSQYLS
jgi:hypothetical protein